MNLTITPSLFIRHNNNNIDTDKKFFTYKNVTGLQQDTVSFQGGEKVLKEGAKRLSKKTGIDINKMLEKPFKKFDHRLREAFGPLVATEKNPNLPIAKIETRIKSPESIAEKGGCRDAKNIVEVTEKIDDLMGGRLELRDVSRDSIQQILKIFEEQVNKGIYSIIEIESYYAEPNLAYVNDKMLSSLVKTCEKRLGAIPVKHKKHPSGYHGVHFTIRMPKDCDNAKAEIQLLGKDTAELKYANDPVYKVLCNKAIQKKYAPIAKILAPLKDEKNETLRNAFIDYTRQAYMYQRRRKSVPFGENIMPPEFLDIPWFLPKELDYKNIYMEMKKIDEAAKKKALAALKKVEEDNQKPSALKAAKAIIAETSKKAGKTSGKKGNTSLDTLV